MATFLMEAVVLCALFHLAIWVQVRQAPARRVYSYAPAFVERYIELGKIPEIKNPSTLERVKKKWPAAIVIGIVLGAIVYFVNGSRSFLNGFLVIYGLWLVVDWYDAIVIDILWLCHSKMYILPGTEDMTADYHDYMFHIKGFLIGEVLALAVCALAGLVVQFIL